MTSEPSATARIALPPPPSSPGAAVPFPAAGRSPGELPVRHTTAATVLFHLGGAALTAGAAFIALVALVILQLGTSCDPDVDGAAQLRDYRIGTIVIGIGLAAVPGLWALIARAARFEWRPWVCVAGLVVAASMLMAANTTEVEEICLHF
jgi:hypothetical protein